LRAHSSNTEVLRACVILAPPSVRIRIFDGLAGLPHFNPDLDVEGAVLPASVEAFRAEINAADALLISSPEYAHGVPGTLKNALDWLVSAPGMLWKPVALLNVLSRSTHANASLLETLRTMSTVPIPEAPVELSLTRRTASADEIAADPQIADRLRISLDALLLAAREYRSRSADVAALVRLSSGSARATPEPVDREGDSNNAEKSGQSHVPALECAVGEENPEHQE
jgi:chromate reductase, NAD(P)H dehydrogenase (quinone)